MSAKYVWGEGFEDDDLFAVASLRNWSQLADGESVRYFPALGAHGGDPAPELVARVASRACQLEAIGEPQATQDARWLMSVLGARGKAFGGSRDMARFAFLTGIHPAYLWTEAAAVPGFGAAAAWLGELSRRGSAYMPPEVADFMGDALSVCGGQVVVREEALAPFITDPAFRRALRRAALRRRTGDSVIVRWRAPSPLWASVSATRARLARATLSWFQGISFIGRSA